VAGPRAVVVDVSRVCKRLRNERNFRLVCSLVVLMMRFLAEKN